MRHLISSLPPTVLHPLPHRPPRSPSLALGATSPALASHSPPPAIRLFLSVLETVQRRTLTAFVRVAGASPSSSRFPGLDIMSRVCLLEYRLSPGSSSFAGFVY